MARKPLVASPPIGWHEICSTPKVSYSIARAIGESTQVPNVVTKRGEGDKENWAGIWDGAGDHSCGH
jgi:hypothetical protein